MTRARRIFGGIAAVALFAAAPLAAQAQPTFVLEIVDRGKPLPDVPVSVREADPAGVAELAGLGKPIGTTGSDGSLTIRNDAANLADGAPMEVWVLDCEDGDTRVILAEEGSGDPCADGAAGEGCGCRRIGVFAWGTGRVVIDVGEGTVTTAPGADDLMPPMPGLDTTQVILGIGLGFSHLPNLEDAVRDQPGLIDADVSSTGITLPASFEVIPPWDLPFTLGVGGAYSSVSEIRQVFDPATNGLSMGTIDFTRWLTWGQVAWYQALLKSPEGVDLVTLRAAFQALWMYNDLEILSEFSGGELAMEDRSESGFRTGVVAGVDLYVTPQLGFRVEGGVLFGEGDDADTSYEGRFILLRRFVF
ncbi:MAG: hypothetical protein ABFS34_16475 [Gemmatimonadota bacterium]